MITMHIRTPRRERGPTQGFTLVEFAIASVLLVVGIMGFMGAIFASQMMVRSTKEQNIASAALVSAAEEFRREAAADFDATQAKYAGDTVFERRFTPDGTIDVVTTTTTSEPPIDNTKTVSEIQAQAPPPSSTPTTVAATPQQIAAAEKAVTLAQKNADRTAATAEKKVAQAKGDPVRLAKALPFIAAAEAAKLTLDAALAELARLTGASGGTSTSVTSTDGTVSTASTSTSGGSTTTQTSSFTTTGSVTQTTTTDNPDGSKTNTNWILTQDGGQLVKQAVGADGTTATTKQTTTVRSETSVKPGTPTEGIFDLAQIASLGTDASASVSLVVDETKIDPPVDLNGDGDFLDTNVAPADLRVSIVRIVIRWRTGNGWSQVENTSVVARGEVETK